MSQNVVSELPLRGNGRGRKTRNSTWPKPNPARPSAPPAKGFTTENPTSEQLKPKAWLLIHAGAVLPHWKQQQPSNRLKHFLAADVLLPVHFVLAKLTNLSDGEEQGVPGGWSPEEPPLQGQPSQQQGSRTMSLPSHSIWFTKKKC